MVGGASLIVLTIQQPAVDGMANGKADRKIGGEKERERERKRESEERELAVSKLRNHAPHLATAIYKKSSAFCSKAITELSRCEFLIALELIGALKLRFLPFLLAPPLPQIVESSFAKS